IKYDAKHGVYLYSPTSDKSAPRILAQSFEGDVLRSTADSAANALATRITVLYNTPLTQIEAHDRAIVVSRKLVTAPDVTLVSDTQYALSGIYARELKAENVMLVLNDGDMGFKNISADNMVIDGKIDSKLRLLNCRTTNMEINAQDNSQLTIGGKVRNLMINIDNRSSVHTTELKCRTLLVNLAGSGKLSSSTPYKLTVNQLGTGKIKMKRYPREVEANVDYDVIEIEK
ncbi:MAG: DUF2807 domain-containing protein, partial [Muribaculaceae bacterium]|nr:DUF2807 domain-containing protein [Muribaculaceae bacterium]